MQWTYFRVTNNYQYNKRGNINLKLKTTIMTTNNLQNGIREVVFIHERGHEMLMVKEQWDMKEIIQIDLAFGGTGVDKLKLIERPVFKSHKGDWTMEEMEKLSGLVIFEEKSRLKTSYGSETFKNEGLAVYDTIAGMIKLGNKKELEIAKSIFEKMFPKLSINNVYAHII